MNFGRKIKYPYRLGQFKVYKHYRICTLCEEKIKQLGIIPMAEHWAKCGVKITMDDIEKLIKK